MSIGLKGFNFQTVQSRIDAARSLQDAGQEDKAKEVLKDLATDILKEIPPTTTTV
jgi:hypothetical protein